MKLAHAFCLLASLAVAGCEGDASPPADLAQPDLASADQASAPDLTPPTDLALPPDPPVPAGRNAVLQWNDAALQAIRTTKPGPPMAARALAMVHTAVFDAWAAYDDVAVGTRYGSTLRRPSAEHTPGRTAMAVSYAALRVLEDFYPTQKAVFDAQATAMGYDPANLSTDPTTPAGIGNKAAAAILANCHIDGANQLGDLVPGGMPYQDYTGYLPVNSPLVVSAAFTTSMVTTPGRWSPLTYTNPASMTVSPGFIGPHWFEVRPFALVSASQLRPVPPPAFDSATAKTEMDELIATSAALTDADKCSAEYWADGPNSELPPGHFNLFAQAVSARDAHTIGDDAKLFFALTNAIFDAGIAVWEAKRYYDYWRPITAIRYTYAGQMKSAWGGPNQGTQTIDMATWRPYQAATFPTPPFPEYPSGHSAFSAAGAEVLKQFASADAFVFSKTCAAASFKFETGPSANVTLSYVTFSELADAAGLSRRFGGIHFKSGDLASRPMGRQAGVIAYSKARSYWLGQQP